MNLPSSDSPSFDANKAGSRQIGNINDNQQQAAAQQLDLGSFNKHLDLSSSSFKNDNLSLEVESAGLAAQRRTPEQLTAMREFLDSLQRSAALSSEAAVSDFQFHLQIAEATGNRYFTDIMNHLGTAIIPRSRLNSARLAHDDQPHYQQRLGREHEQIYDAIARQDAESARAAMRLHLTNSRERLRQAHEEAETEKVS